MARADVGFWEGVYECEWFSFYAFALSGRGCYIFVSHTPGVASLALGATLGFQPALAKTNRTQIEFLRNTLNRLFERALHAVLFTLMAAKAINTHQCFALRVRSTLWNGH